MRERARETHRGAGEIWRRDANSARKNLQRVIRCVLVSVGERVRGSRKHWHRVAGLWLDAPDHGETGLAYDIQYIHIHIFHHYTHINLHIHVEYISYIHTNTHSAWAWKRQPMARPNTRAQAPRPAREWSQWRASWCAGSLIHTYRGGRGRHDVIITDKAAKTHRFERQDQLVALPRGPSKVQQNKVIVAEIHRTSRQAYLRCACVRLCGCMHTL